MDVKKIVDFLYEDDWRDRYLPVSRYRYKQQILRMKIEIANLHLEDYRTKQALNDAQISVPPFHGREEEIKQLVEEDELAFEVDMEKNTYDRREKAYENQELVETIRRLLTGVPIDPYDPDEEVEHVEPYAPENSKEAQRIYMAGVAKKEKEQALKQKESPPSRLRSKNKESKRTWFKRKKTPEKKETEVDEVLERINKDLEEMKDTDNVSTKDITRLEQAIADAQAAIE